MSQSSTKWSRPWTALKVLKWTAQYFDNRGVSETPRLDAEVLLADVLGIDRVEIYANFNRPLEPEERAAFREKIKKRVAGKPVAYIAGTREFWSIELKTDERALIPRPETEGLVKAALEFLEAHSIEEPRMLEVGTGTGAVALALLEEVEGLTATATDVSPEALELAEENAERLGLRSRIEFTVGDLFENVEQTYDILVSNPPYVGREEYENLEPNIREYEPEIALVGGETGVEFSRQLVESAPRHLRRGGFFACEIDRNRAGELEAALRRAGFVSIEIDTDLAGHDRIATARLGESEELNGDR